MIAVPSFSLDFLLGYHQSFYVWIGRLKETAFLFTNMSTLFRRYFPVAAVIVVVDEALHFNN